MATTAEKLSGIFSATIPFVMARRKTTGGFGATPMLPATIEDTYHSLRVLMLAGKYNALDKSQFNPQADEQLRSYLNTRWQTAAGDTRTTFQLLWCCQRVGLAFNQKAVEAEIIARMEADGSLQNWYYGTRILKEILGRGSLSFDDNRKISAVLDSTWRTVDEAWKHLYLSRKLRNTLPQPAPEMSIWFRACQNGDGGFGFLTRTTSFVENCYTCLRALVFLNAAPLYPDRAFRFLARAQTTTGGFGRSSKAVAFLYSTWQAIAALAILESGAENLENYFRGS
jgi:hypothetical protein